MERLRGTSKLASGVEWPSHRAKGSVGLGARILGYLQGRREATAREIAEGLDVNSSNVRITAGALADAGAVRRRGTGGFNDPYRFSLKVKA